MSDIVERLKCGPSTSTDFSLHLRKYQALCNEAADEIERLRADRQPKGAEPVEVAAFAAARVSVDLDDHPSPAPAGDWNAAKERAAIVKWLRETHRIDASTSDVFTEPFFGGDLSKMADAIERGDHLSRPAQPEEKK